MTTVDTTRTYEGNGIAVATNGADYYVFPDPPEDPLDKMANFDHITATGNAHHLAMHLGELETTLIAGERYMCIDVTGDMTGLRYPDMLIAFDVSPAEYKRRKAYVISEQGKPPDFVLEIASPSTGDVDVGPKREDYAALSIPEYWRFDETGQFHGTRLAGDRLVDGHYEPVEIIELEDGVLQGYSEVLNLNLRWEDGELRWHDPETGRHIATFESERERANEERARADREWQSHMEQRTRADREQARADALEAELRQLRNS